MNTPSQKQKMHCRIPFRQCIFAGSVRCRFPSGRQGRQPIPSGTVSQSISILSLLQCWPRLLFVLENYHFARDFTKMLLNQIFPCCRVSGDRILRVVDQDILRVIDADLAVAVDIRRF